MPTRREGSKNRGKSLFGENGGKVQFQKNEIFIGVVDQVVGKDSDVLESIVPESTDNKELFDNRTLVYVNPIELNEPDTLVKAYFINSHSLDVPLVGEAVLCCKTNVGNIIIDRFSPHAFGINFELSDYLLSNKLYAQGNTKLPEFSLSGKAKKELGMSSVEEVSPFFPQLGSKVFLGRNNQYMIFSHGPRYESDAEEQRFSEDGNFIKIGFREPGNQIDAKADPSLILVAQRAKVQALMEATIESKHNPDPDQEPDNGMGFQSDELVFFGRRFVVLYSRQNMLLKGEGNLFLEFREIIQQAEKIRLGEKADDPAVLGNKLVEMIGDLVEILNAFTLLTSQGPTTGLAPNTRAKLTSFKQKYIKRDNSPIHSKRTFLDKG